jgi:glucose-6-phosphate-specific signal transduction histidine kinase
MCVIFPSGVVDVSIGPPIPIYDYLNVYDTMADKLVQEDALGTGLTGQVTVTPMIMCNHSFFSKVQWGHPPTINQTINQSINQHLFQTVQFAININKHVQFVDIT